MANQLELSPDLSDYVRAHSLREDDILRQLRETTSQLPGGTTMQVMAEEGQLLALLTGLTGGRDVVEVGTFTGYSTLCMARALAPGGRVVTIDITRRWHDIAADAWREAGVADRIDQRIGDAATVLADLLDERGPGSADLVFIDANKQGYRQYYEGALALVRDTGLIVVDNTLYFGRVTDPAAQDAETVAIREFNELLRDDERVDISMLTFADGITLVRRKNA
jgi:O-methyltransferase